MEDGKLKVTATDCSTVPCGKHPSCNISELYSNSQVRSPNGVYEKSVVEKAQKLAKTIVFAIWHAQTV